MSPRGAGPVTATYFNVQEARVSAVLLATWDADPIAMPCPYFEFVSLAFTYTRGEAGGSFDWQIESSLYSIVANMPAGAQEWQDPAIYASGAVAAGADTQSRDQREYETYQATGAAVETFNIGPVPLHGTFERIRIVARESSGLQTLGTLQIQAHFG